MLGEMYILDEEGKPVPEPDSLVWAEWFEHANRLVERTAITSKVTVSTIFLGLDHSFFRDDKPPVLWETMIFGGKHDLETWRYTSREDAVLGHACAVQLAREG
jgi:hypothetical protein